MKNLIKYYEAFKKSMIANKALKDFNGGDNREFTRLQRNATRWHNIQDDIRSEFTTDESEIYNSVKDAWNTFDSIFVKGK
jgi:hypothetical protein